MPKTVVMPYDTEGFAKVLNVLHKVFEGQELDEDETNDLIDYYTMMYEAMPDGYKGKLPPRG